MRGGYFVSDLHLFARHSQGGSYTRSIRSAASRASFMVFGGDTFDFRWSFWPDDDETAEQALKWLRRLASGRPECRFHLVLGNHDYNRALLRRLDGFESQVENFDWHPFYLRLGSRLFLHGDAADRASEHPERLERRRNRWLNDRKRGPLMCRGYRVAVGMGLHRPVNRISYRRRTVARRIHKYLENINEGPARGVTDVYFGHTHSPMSDFTSGGLTFHNGGSAVRGLQFRLVEVPAG